MHHGTPSPLKKLTKTLTYGSIEAMKGVKKNDIMILAEEDDQSGQETVEDEKIDRWRKNDKSKVLNKNGKTVIDLISY